MASTGMASQEFPQRPQRTLRPEGPTAATSTRKLLSHDGQTSFMTATILWRSGWFLIGGPGR